MTPMLHRTPKAKHVRSHWEKIKPRVYLDHISKPRLSAEERAHLIGELEELKLQAQSAENHEKSEAEKVSARQSAFYIDQGLKHLGVKKKG